MTAQKGFTFSTKGFTTFMKTERGFTFVELLVAITIVAILSVIGLITYAAFLNNARDARRQSDLKLIQSALEQYHGDQKYYPYSGSVTSGQPLTNATGAPSGTITSKTYLNSIPQDPKGSPAYAYKSYKDGTECVNVDVGQCKRYCLFAYVENPSNVAELTSCSNITGYNYEVTSP